MITKDPSPPVRWPAGMIGILAVSLLVCAVPLCANGTEPFVTWFYVICWYSLIVALDALEVLAGGRSLITGCHSSCRVWFLPALIFWSAVIWFFFEVVNIRLANWYYVNVSDLLWIQVIGSIVAFGTVLPALFLIESLLERTGLFRKLRWRAIVLERRGRAVLVIVGLLCMTLPLVWPRYFFPLVWFGMAFLLAPVNMGRLERSLLGDLAAGRYGRLLRVLLAGLICGLVWEFLNSFARIRWIYTVPFLEDVKLFEMPPLGFLGFPPFAVEATVIYGTLVGLGLAPGCRAIRRRTRGEETAAQPKIRIRAARVSGGLAGGVFMVFALYGMLNHNVDSTTPRLAALSLPAPVLELSGNLDISDAFALRTTLEDHTVAAILEREGVDVVDVSRLLDLATLRGIGAVHAAALKQLGIDGPEELAGRDAEELARALTGLERLPRPLDPSRVKVWIAAAAAEN